MELRPALRAIAADNWRLRWNVEREASLRFARMAERLRALNAPDALVELALKAVGDEQRHTQLCASLTARYGEPVDASIAAALPDIEPTRLSMPEKTTYEIVSACCITETESTGVVTTLLKADPEPEVREALHIIARDEVDHARLGWAYLSWVRERQPLAFMAPLIPIILSGTVKDSLFAPPTDANLDDAELLRAGVSPWTQKREIFAGMLRDVVFPGFDELGLSSVEGRAWLDARAPKSN